jgi:hypothetical protein
MNKIQTKNCIFKFLFLLTATDNAFPFEVPEMVISMTQLTAGHQGIGCQYADGKSA